MALLDKIVRGKQSRPVRLLVHGQPGCGKSTFAAGAPDPLFLDFERRTEHLDVARYEPTEWSEVMPFIGEVLKAKACGTLVLDTLDHLEMMVWAHLCKRDGVTSIADVNGGYGRGYLAALGEFRRLFAGLEMLRAAGIHVVMLAHSAVKEFKNPAGENYDQYAIKLDQRARALCVEKADAVGFATWADYARKEKNAPKAKAITTGERVLRFDHNPAYDSKAGFPLPAEMKLEWSEFAKHLSTETTKENA